MVRVGANSDDEHSEADVQVIDVSLSLVIAPVC